VPAALRLKPPSVWEVRLSEPVATRLYVAQPLAAGGRIALTPSQEHRLRHVLRLRPGASVAAFNAEHGEWLCRLAELRRGSSAIDIVALRRSPGPERELCLIFAPIRRARLDWLVEKATELGVSALIPVQTARTQAPLINRDHLAAVAIAAAEQSERLSIPEIRAVAPLDRVLGGLPADCRLIACDESGAGMPIAAALAELPAGPAAALLIGPEGGFARTELDAIGKLPIVTRVALGPKVLRAETAALAALAVFQAIAGDWRGARRG